MKKKYCIPENVNLDVSKDTYVNQIKKAFPESKENLIERCFIA